MVRRIIINATIKQAIIWVGKLLLDDRRRGMLDSAGQAEVGDRQHNEMGGWATTGVERVI